MTTFSDAVHIDSRRLSDTTHRTAGRKRELNEDEIFSVITSVRKVLETEFADEKDRAVFTLYERCAKFRRALEQIASYPRASEPEETAINALDWPSIKLGGKFEVPDTEMETAVNKVLAVTHFSGLPSGAEVMCKGAFRWKLGFGYCCIPKPAGLPIGAMPPMSCQAAVQNRRCTVTGETIRQRGQGLHDSG